MPADDQPITSIPELVAKLRELPGDAVLAKRDEGGNFCPHGDAANLKRDMAVREVHRLLLRARSALLNELKVARTKLATDVLDNIAECAGVEGWKPGIFDADGICTIAMLADAIAAAHRRAAGAGSGRWRVRAKARARTPARPQKDGPILPNSLRYRGKQIDDVQPIPNKLLHYMWDKDRALVVNVECAVWGDESDGDGRLKAAMNKANQALQRVSCPKVMSRTDEFVTLG